MLEETGLPYNVTAIDITKGEQFDPDFIRISPNSKIPAIVDREADIAVMESGAILLYLAEKTGRFIPATNPGRASVFEWLMFQMGGLGPTLGQVHHFAHFNPGKSDYATDRFVTEARRLYGVLEMHLARVPYLAGEEYSIADMATWPWVARFEWQRIDLREYPSVNRWYMRIEERPAVRRGYRVPGNAEDIPMPAAHTSTQFEPDH